MFVLVNKKVCCCLRTKNTEGAASPQLPRMEGSGSYMLIPTTAGGLNPPPAHNQSFRRFRVGHRRQFPPLGGIIRHKYSTDIPIVQLFGPLFSAVRACFGRSTATRRRGGGASRGSRRTIPCRGCPCRRRRWARSRPPDRPVARGRASSRAAGWRSRHGP